MKSQKQQVLEYLQKGYSLTPKEALKMFGSFRLSAVIFDLVAEGYNIINVQSMDVWPDGCGVNSGMKKEKTRWGEYFLQKEQPIKLTAEQYKSASEAACVPRPFIIVEENK